MKYELPTNVRIHGTDHPYSLILDTEDAAMIELAPPGGKRDGDEAVWPPTIALPAAEFIASLVLFQRVEQARENILARAMARGRAAEVKSPERSLLVTLNGYGMPATLSIVGPWVLFKTEVESAIGTFPILLYLTYGEIIDVVEYMAALDKSESTLESIELDTTKLLAAASEALSRED